MGIDGTVTGDSVELVAKRLGRRSADLYARVVELLARGTPGETPTRRALRLIVINLLAGAYHDYRTEGLMPKADLVVALRELPRDRPLLQLVVDLESDVLRGVFDEDESEGKRWAERMVAAESKQKMYPVPVEDMPPGVEAHTYVELTPREREVFEWLYRYSEVYKRPPSQREIAEGCSIATSRVGQVLRQLEAKHVVHNLGGPRGWMPTRRP